MKGAGAQLVQHLDFAQLAIKESLAMKVVFVHNVRVMAQPTILAVYFNPYQLMDLSISW